MKKIVYALCFCLVALGAVAQNRLIIKTKDGKVTPVFTNTIRKTYVDMTPTYNMTLVEGGTFNMGSNASDANHDEKPVHSVTLSSFYIGEYEVTQQMWQAVMGTNPSQFVDAKKPVEKISWYDAIEFCNALSIKEGLDSVYQIVKTTKDPYNQNDNDTKKWFVVPLPTANGYRLPTEAQWEYASRGGENSNGYIYSGSNTINNVAWYNSNSSNKTQKVGEKSANELGLYDMSGNVAEWCFDWKGSYTSSSQTNPTGATMGSDRVVRGGSYSNDAWTNRVSQRGSETASNIYKSVGLRLVRLAD